MATFRVPGVFGLPENPSDAESVGDSEFHWDRHRVPAGNYAAPGPVKLMLVPHDAVPTKQAQTKAAKPAALIIIGAGQDDLRKGVQFRKDKYFKEAALEAFKQYTKTHVVKFVFVKSTSETVGLIEAQSWDVVVYFGHGYLTSKELVPGFGANSGEGGLTEDQLIGALKKAKAKGVYLFGCRAGYTGLARSVSNNLPGVTVSATFSDLDVDWVQSGTTGRGGRKKLIENKFIMKEELTEYKNGFQTKNGIKTKQRKMEMNDAYNSATNPLDDEIDQ